MPRSIPDRVFNRIQPLFGRWAEWWLWGALLFFVYDISHDLLEEGLGAEVIIEGITFFAVLTMLYGEWRRNQRLETDLEVAQEETVKEREKAEEVTAKLAGEFTAYVQATFGRWALSRSEAEVAWLLVKGFPFAEIASVRGVQEKTVRQQATAIYAKSGCKSRNELVAFFIEDLLAGDALPAASSSPSDEPAVTSASDRAPE